MPKFDFSVLLIDTGDTAVRFVEANPNPNGTLKVGEGVDSKAEWIALCIRRHFSTGESLVERNGSSHSKVFPTRVHPARFLFLIFVHPAPCLFWRLLALGSW
jgi:hypothetical protein